MRTEVPVFLQETAKLLFFISPGVLVAIFAVGLMLGNISAPTTVIEAVPEIEPMPIPVVTLGPTLTITSGTYTEAEFADRVAKSIETYGFRNVCILHVQNLALGTLPYRGFDRDAYRALAFYAAACADLLENYLPEDYLLEETGS